VLVTSAFLILLEKKMDEQSHQMPFDIEAPVPIMFWDPLEFIVAVTLIGFGIITKAWIFGVAGGTAVLMGSRYLKRGTKRGAMQHFLWGHGLQMDPALTKKFKPAWLNDFIE
jgi:hypothetical protein